MVQKEKSEKYIHSNCVVEKQILSLRRFLYLSKLFTENLVHDSLAIRKVGLSQVSSEFCVGQSSSSLCHFLQVAISSMGAILKLQKRKHTKVLIDPYAQGKFVTQFESKIGAIGSTLRNFLCILHSWCKQDRCHPSRG